MQGAQGISELIKEKYITLSCQEHTQSSLGNTFDRCAWRQCPSQHDTDRRLKCGEETRENMTKMPGHCIEDLQVIGDVPQRPGVELVCLVIGSQLCVDDVSQAFAFEKNIFTLCTDSEKHIFTQRLGCLQTKQERCWLWEGKQ